MADTIFKTKSDKVSMSKNLISFKDCPNGCIDGYYVNPYTHKRVLCEYCEEKRKSVVKEDLIDESTKKSLKELLHLPDNFSGISFSIDSVLPKFALKDIKEDSLNNVKDVLTSLLNDISIGTLPSCSYLFNLGKKAYENNYIYAYLTRAYMSGLTVAPLITALDLCSLRNQCEIGVKDENDLSYKDLLNSDICIVSIDAGATYRSVNAVKGFMQLRANRNKATIVFTNSWGSQIFDLCSEEDECSYNLAKLVSIEYTDSYKAREGKYLDSNIDSSTGKIPASLTTEQFKSLIS